MPRRVDLLILSVAAVTVAVVVIAGRPPAPPQPPAGPDGPAAGRLPPASAQRLMRRVLARDRVARDVADGRRSVLEAAAVYRALDRTDPPHAPPPTDPHSPQGVPLPVEFPAATEGEAYCRQVVYWAYLAVRSESPARAEAVARRLAEQVRAEVRAKGAITLADPAGLAGEAERLITEAKWVPHGPANNH